jgi:predicted metalloprotease with PDZ domain
MLYLPPSVSINDLQQWATIAHEMVHAWGLYLEAGPLLDNWYTEGIADYFALTLPYAAGLYTQAEYLALINRDAEWYYTNARRLTPDHDVPATMWAGGRSWTLSYARGILYFANLDAKLRQASSPHTVLSFANELLTMQRAGQAPTAQDWVALLRPLPGAFGPTVMSQPVKTGFYDLGFAEPVNVQAGKRIKGLVPGSPAALAGLREGDELADAVKANNSLLPNRFNQPTTLTVRRNEAPVPVTYLPQGGPAEAWEWVAAPAKP